MRNALALAAFYAAATYSSHAQAAPSVRLSVSPTTVAQSEPVTIRWSSKGASRCEMVDGATVASVPLSGNLTKHPKATQRYIVRCTGGGDRVGKAIKVVVTAEAEPTPTPTPTPSSSIGSSSRRLPEPTRHSPRRLGRTRRYRPIRPVLTKCG